MHISSSFTKNSLHECVSRVAKVTWDNVQCGKSMLDILSRDVKHGIGYSVLTIKSTAKETNIFQHLFFMI